LLRLRRRWWHNIFTQRFFFYWTKQLFCYLSQNKTNVTREVHQPESYLIWRRRRCLFIDLLFKHQQHLFFCIIATRRIEEKSLLKYSVHYSFTPEIFILTYLNNRRKGEEGKKYFTLFYVPCIITTGILNILWLCIYMLSLGFYYLSCRQLQSSCFFFTYSNYDFCFVCVLFNDGNQIMRQSSCKEIKCITN
jgi:hypothetical protein